MADLDAIPVVITAGQSLSAPVVTGVKVLIGIYLPANWTAATHGLTFQASADGSVYGELLDGQSGNAVAVPTAAAVAGAFIAMSNPNQWAAVNQFRIRSGTVANPDVQAATVTITVLVRGVAL